MRSAFAHLFLLTGAVQVVAVGYLFLKPLLAGNAVSPEQGEAICQDVITGGQTSLLFFLVVGSLTLAHMLLEVRHRAGVGAVWGTLLLLLMLFLIFVQFSVFREHPCESALYLWSKLLITTLSLVLMALAISFIDGRFPGAVFLLTAVALICVLSLSLLKMDLVTLSSYGYFCHVVLVVVLAITGTGMVLGPPVPAAAQLEDEVEPSEPGPDAP